MIAAVDDLPDEIFAQGFDKANSQCIINTDCPPAGSECQFNACTDGLCAMAPAVSGAACSAGVCNGAGSCVACLSATDCPATGSECKARTCTANLCGQSLLPMGTACSEGVCDGTGTCVGCLAPGDCPATGSECILKACTAGACTPTLAPMGTACSAGLCDVVGSCVQCLSASDCPATGNECKLSVCTSGICGTQNAAFGTACSTGICDGMGMCVAATTNYGWPDPFGNILSVGNGSVVAYRITLANAATLDKFGIYTTSASGDWKLALYSDSSNQPGSLVAQMDARASIASAGNQNADIADVALAAGDYWIAYRSSPALSMGYSGTDPSAKMCSRNTSILSLDTAWPATFGAASCSTTGILNLYIVTHE
jgi:hypothetical protein